MAWDEYVGLHPDERFLLFVSFDMMRGLDEALAEGVGISDLWFETGVSPLDPRLGGRVYVYGEAPTIGLALALRSCGIGGWSEALHFARSISAGVDAFTVIATAILGYELWRSASAALLAAALYAAAPTALQLAGFLTVDVLLVACFAWCGVLLVFLLRARSAAGQASAAIGAGACIGLAVACKLPGGALSVPALVALALVLNRTSVRAALGLGSAMALAAAVTFRLLNPFAFAGPDILGLAPSQSFVHDIREFLGRSLSVGFPPDWQWLAGYSTLELLRDFALFGAGPVLAVAAVMGALVAVVRAPRGAALALALALPILAFAVTTETPALRYAAPALPALAAIAGVAASAIAPVASVLIALAAAYWGSGVVALHTSEHTRLAASRWLWTLPAGTILANETAWDDGLPVPVRLRGSADPVWPGQDYHFTLETLMITDHDDPAKAERLARLLDEADFLVISSGRQRAVMPRLPDLFPMTTAYYRMLGDGTLCYASVWRSNLGYPLPGWRIDDAWAQEPWRVYDHPIVEIFQRQPCYDSSAVERALLAALNAEH